MVRHGANRDRIRGSVARTREATRVHIGDDMSVLRGSPCHRPIVRARLQGYVRSLLARIRTYHWASVLAQRNIDRIGLTGEHQSMAVFSTATVLWGFGWLIYMGGYGLEIHDIWKSFSVWIGLRGSVLHFEYWDNWNGFGQLATTGRTGSGSSLMGWYQQFMALAKEYPNYGATILGVAGMFFTALFGWLLKRPMARQAVKTDEFNATIKGMRELIESQRLIIEDHEKDREHWARGRAQLVLRIEDLEARLQPWSDTPGDSAIIIVVEDNNASARSICRMLERMQLEAFVTTRGHDALRHLRSGQFKLMVLDFGLPDINGIDVAILARRQGIDIPIIGLTGVAIYLPKDSPQMLEAKFSAVLPKTSRADEIMSAIRRALETASGGAGRQGNG